MIPRGALVVLAVLALSACRSGLQRAQESPDNPVPVTVHTDPAQGTTTYDLRRPPPRHLPRPTPAVVDRVREVDPLPSTDAELGDLAASLAAEFERYRESARRAVQDGERHGVPERVVGGHRHRLELEGQSLSAGFEGLVRRVDGAKARSPERRRDDVILEWIEGLDTASLFVRGVDFTPAGRRVSFRRGRLDLRFDVATLDAVAEARADTLYVLDTLARFAAENLPVRSFTFEVGRPIAYSRGHLDLGPAMDANAVRVLLSRAER